MSSFDKVYFGLWALWAWRLILSCFQRHEWKVKVTLSSSAFCRDISATSWHSIVCLKEPIILLFMCVRVPYTLSLVIYTLAFLQSLFRIQADEGYQQSPATCCPLLHQSQTCWVWLQGYPIFLHSQQDVVCDLCSWTVHSASLWWQSGLCGTFSVKKNGLQAFIWLSDACGNPNNFLLSALVMMMGEMWQFHLLSLGMKLFMLSAID